MASAGARSAGARAARPEVALGGVTRHALWGRGIATEAAAAWRDHAFEVLGLTRIVSMIDEANAASRRVAKKIGMSLERPAIWGDQPMLMYSLVSRRAGPGP